ncbi:hypothetical protein N9K58_04935 [Alphaproteobacteria bacterium]|nr:hypothetical protein [Alphaproteobacteria bacterium]
MKNKILLLSLCIPAFFTSVATSAETYDDCVLKGLDGVTSDFIAKQVVKSCESKYLKSASNEPAVPPKPKSTTIEVGYDTKWKIPVPAGEYVKTGSRTMYGQTVPLVFEIYEHIEDGKLKYLLWVSYSKNRNSNRWKASKTCNRKNLHYIKKVKNRNGSTECLLVNHWRIIGGGSTKNPNAAYNKVRDDAKKWHRENGIPIPNTMISASSIFAEENRLEVRVLFNPEFDGFPPTKDSNWSSNDWHQDKIIGDKKRTDYIQTVKAFAEDMHQQLKPQFKR